MTSPNAHLTARCRECGHAYRVPNANRTYTCKGCGGTVEAGATHAPHEAQAPVLEGSVSCEECRAVNPGGTEYCVECGVSLPPSRPHPGSQAARRIRHDAALALKRAALGFRIVTWTYQLGAVLFGAAAMSAVLALTRADVPPDGGVLVVALTTLLSVLFGMGALHIHFKPFIWTMAIALVTTAATVVHLVGPNPFGLAVYGTAAWAVLAIALLVPTFWFRRLIATHRDLYVLHQASAQTRRSLLKRSAHERHERLMQAMHRAARRTWMISTSIAVLVILASALGTWSVLTGLRLHELGDAVLVFETAWNQDDLDGVERLLDEQVRELESRRLEGLVAGHGWRGALPQLGSGRVEEQPQRASIDYRLEDLTLTAQWRRNGAAWALVRVEIPVPSAAPTVEAFAAAWQDSDLQTLVSFFAADARAEMLDNITSAMAGRGWRTLPPVQSTRLGEDGGDASATLILEQGEVSTEWRFRVEGDWRLHALRLPKR